MHWVRYDKESGTHSTLRLERDGWHLEVRRASALVADRRISHADAYNCITFYDFRPVRASWVG